jgi:hypothetical protein
VYFDDQVPILILHVLKADIAEDTSVVDEDVDATERLDGGFDDPLAVFDTVVVSYGLAAGGFDLVYDYIGGLEIDWSTLALGSREQLRGRGRGEESMYLCRVALALEGTTKVVNDNLRSSRSEECGICFSQTTASASDDSDLAVVAQLSRHRVSNELWETGYQR